jgi:Cu/Ag efflux protein CusF
MRRRALFISVLPFSLLLLIVCSAKSTGPFPSPDGEATNARMFIAKGVVQELNPDGRTVVIRHEAISNYMAAMTMPFKAKAPAELAGLHRGDEISFQLHVTETESWVDGIVKIGIGPRPPDKLPVPVPAAKTEASRPGSPLNWARR